MEKVEEEPPKDRGKGDEEICVGAEHESHRMVEAFDPKTYDEALRMTKVLEVPQQEKNLEPIVVVGNKCPIEAKPTKFQLPPKRPRYHDRRPTLPPVN